MPMRPARIGATLHKRLDLRRWQAFIRNAKRVKQGDRIVFGATVTLSDDDDKQVRYQIVGQTEADAKVGRISYNSPLGKALIGRKVGDEIEVTVPSGDRFYLVEKIEFI